MRTLSIAFAALALLAFGPEPSTAQDLHPSRRPSPIGIAKTFLGDTYVKVTYGRPYMRGREIFGANTDETTYLVPFGELWRTGANEATEITLTGPVEIDDQRLEAGTYAIFTVPDEESWEIHFSPQLGLDGTGQFDPETGNVEPAYDPANDVLVVEAPVHQTAEPTDQFTISFEEAGAGTDLVFRWENTEVRLPLQQAS